MFKRDFCQEGIKKFSQYFPCKFAAIALVMIGDELSVDSSDLVFKFISISKVYNNCN